MLTMHILAGGLGLMSGVAALYAAKGARLHRTSGMVFAYAAPVRCQNDVWVPAGVIVATVVPAWRASRTSPLSALRHQ